jgi:hypothetical protein
MTANRAPLGDAACDTWHQGTGVATTDQNARAHDAPSGRGSERSLLRPDAGQLQTIVMSPAQFSALTLIIWARRVRVFPRSLVGSLELGHLATQPLQ